MALSGTEESEALELLRSPGLLDRIVADFDRCSVVGEELNSRSPVELGKGLPQIKQKVERSIEAILEGPLYSGRLNTRQFPNNAL